MEEFKNTLLTPMEQRFGVQPSGNIYIEFINTLEGVKTKIKNLHWSAFNMNTHKQLDELASIISDYQDSLAEDYQGITTKFQPSFLRGIPCDCTDPISLLQYIKMHTIEFYKGINSDPCFVGIKSETETLIHDINKQIYLFNLCL